jgi:two-component system NtrC family sensor kinase
MQMKALLKMMILLLLPAVLFGQQYEYYRFPDKTEFDSLRKVFPAIKSDTERMAVYRRFGFYFLEAKRDSSFYFLDHQLVLARKFGLKLWEADALDNSAYILWRLGNFPEALQRLLLGIKIAEDPASEKNTWGFAKFTADKIPPRTTRLVILAELHFDLGTLYGEAGYTNKQFTELSKGEKIGKENRDSSALSQIYEGLGGYYLSRRQTDSALICLKKSVACAEQSGFKIFEGESLDYMGNACIIKGDFAAAKANFFRSVSVNIGQHSSAGLTHDYLSLAGLFIKQSNSDSGLYYAEKALALTKITNDLSDAANTYNALSGVFKIKNNIDSAYKYQSMALAAKDRLNNAEKAKQFQNIGFTEQLRVQQLEEEKIAVQNKVRIYAMLAGLGVVLLIALILYRNNRQKQKANKVLESTLTNLKSTQTQLIQSEKMASLGELTAGIAHEIQNPLNFVNNFSEVNTELIDEMEQEIDKGDLQEIKAIALDIRENEKKINMHGKRADAIVKGMLQHSQSGSGVKEPTNINAVADECMRLAYHGLRAKDKSFNAELVTHLDETLPKINVIQQDMVRVLLNLFNNAFYAVNQKSKTADQDYKPEVSVNTSTENGRIIIKVKDNGIGIPDAIKEKIMQPFFTTKPTGEGTGLGLSLTYDMVVKGHGGSVQVESVVGDGSEFIIQLPDLTKT